MADDHEAVRRGVRSLLDRESDVEVVGEAADGLAAIELVRAVRPDVIVLDHHMPGIAGLEVARAVAVELPGTGIVFLTSDPSVPEALPQNVAAACVLKDEPPPALLRAIRECARDARPLRELSRGWARAIEELLAASGATYAQLAAGLRARRAGESPARPLLRDGAVADADLAAALAAASRTALVSLAPYPQVRGPIEPGEERLASPRMIDPVEHAAARRPPRAFCESRGLVITSAAGRIGVVAMVDPFDVDTHREAERKSGLRLRRVTAALGEIRDALDRAWAAYVELPVISLGDPRRGQLSFLAVSAAITLAVTTFLYVFRDGLQARYLFVFLALSCGFLFFAYALRYYVASAAVLTAALVGDLMARRPFTRRRTARARGYRTLRGEALDDGGGVLADEPWPRIGDRRVPRERQPFVSVHLALYNEQRVVDRLLTACTSFDYENYEVIVVDDSTDGTVPVLERWAAHPRVRVIHRASRAGFKGGALQEALRRTHARAEYVMVFDADFVPPPNVIWHFLDYFGRLPSANGNGNGKGGGHARAADGAPLNGDRLAAVQGYQWHMLNAGENWVTKGIRVEFAGSYVLERAAQELFGTMKMIAGSVYMIRADVLRKLGWSTSITEDWELTIRLYLAGYKVLYTPYIQAPAECVSAIRRLIRQRMRWAEGHTYNVKRYWWKLLRSPNLDWREKLEFVYYAPYYLQSVVFCAGTVAWLLGVFFLDQRLPMWSEVLGWSLVVTNALALPLMNLAAVLLEGSLRRDAAGLLSSIALSWILVPFQAYAALKGLLEPREGDWARTPKSGRVTEPLAHFRLAHLLPWELPRRRRAKAARGPQLVLTSVALALAVGVLAIGALSIRAVAATGSAREHDYVVPAVLGTAVPLLLLLLAWRALKRRLTAVLLIFGLAATTNVVFLAHAVPADAAASNDSTFMFRNTTAFNPPNPDMVQAYTPTGAASQCPGAAGNGWTCTWSSDTFATGQTLGTGATVHLYPENTVSTIAFRSSSSVNFNTSFCTLPRPAGLATGDVMLAACALRGGSGTLITGVPSGWTLVNRTDNLTTLSLAVYVKVVTDAATEPASYVWSLSASVKGVGALLAYSGVDSATPIHVQDGQATPNSTSHATPSVTTTAANAMLVSFHGVATRATWTPPAGMTERVDATSASGGANSNAAIEGNDEPQGTAGATGVKAATSSDKALGIAGIVALRPAARTCALTVELLHTTLLGVTTTLGSGTASTTSPSGPTLVSTTFSTLAVVFADGDRVHVRVTAPADAANCNARVHFDGATAPSRLVTATIVPEGILALLLLAPALPFVARRLSSRRNVAPYAADATSSQLPSATRRGCAAGS